MSQKYTYNKPKVVGILRIVIAPGNAWKCTDCGKEILCGDKCWKQGSKIMCGCKFGSQVCT